MKNIKVDYSWLKNSAITGVNQLPEHSEHYYFDKYVGINQLDYFQIDMMHLNNNWTFMKSDFNKKNGDDEYTLVTLFNHFKGEDKLITKNIILKMQSFNLPVYIWMNGCFVGFSKGLEQSIEFEITNILRLDENELIIKVCSIEEEKQNKTIKSISLPNSLADEYITLIKSELKEVFGYEVSEDEIFTTTPIISTHTGENAVGILVELV